MFNAFNTTLNFLIDETLKSRGLELLSFLACSSHFTANFAKAKLLSY